jgi:hypothetical protein
VHAAFRAALREKLTYTHIHIGEKLELTRIPSIMRTLVRSIASPMQLLKQQQATYSHSPTECATSHSHIQKSRHPLQPSYDEFMTHGMFYSHIHMCAYVHADYVFIEL